MDELTLKLNPFKPFAKIQIDNNNARGRPIGPKFGKKNRMF
jgi:hypothetical protein